MFEVKICRLVEAKPLRDKWATHTVSLVSPRAELEFDDKFTQDYLGAFLTDNTLNHHVEYMHDVSTEDVRYDYPKKEHIQRILDFTKDLKETDRLLVHCHAGISRSTATAIGILVQHGMHPVDAINEIERIRPILWPNILLVQLFDKALNKNNQLYDTYGAWKNVRQGKIVIPTAADRVADRDQMQKWMKLI